MLMLTILVLAALAAPCFVGAQYSLTIFDTSFITSLNKPFQQQCLLLNPYWTETFYSQKVSIESVFTDVAPNSAIPTIMTSVRITFTQGTATQTYSAPNPSLPLSSTFLSGLSSVSTSAGQWLTVQFLSVNTIIINDFSTQSSILLGNFGGRFSIFYFGQLSSFSSANGLLIQGCPNAAVYPYLGYHANPNVGRRKRQTDECYKVASEITAQLSNNKLVELISQENIEAYKIAAERNSFTSICDNDKQFSGQSLDIMNQILKAVVQAKEIYNKNFGQVKG